MIDAKKLKLVKSLSDVIKLAICCKDETQVTLYARTQNIQPSIWVVRMRDVERLSDHCVLAHQHDGLAAEIHADILHLL